MARTIVLDACVLINLAASGEIADLLKIPDTSLAICEAVFHEVHYLRPEDTGAEPEPLMLHQMASQLEIQVLRLRSESEKNLYITLAVDLDDGEAMSVAPAMSRGYILATDDRKARRLFSSLVPDTDRLTSTPQMVRDWAARTLDADDRRVQRVVSRVRRNARYWPRDSDPEGKWWLDLLERAEESDG